MRFIILVAAILGLTIALPASKSKRDAPYPAAVPFETYGLPVVKVVEVHDTPDCVVDGRWIDDVQGRKWNIDDDKAPEITDNGLVTKTVVVETPHTDYGLPKELVVLPAAPVLSALPEPILKVETPAVVYGPPVVKEAPYPAAIPHEVYGLPVVKVETVDDNPNCPVDARWVDDVSDKKWNVDDTVVVEALHTDYGLPVVKVVEPEVPHVEYGLPEVKVEVPVEVYGPPLVKEAPYPAAVVEVKVEEVHDESCVADGRWINDVVRSEEPTGPYPAYTATVTHHEDTVHHSLELPGTTFDHTNFVHTF